MPPPPMSWGGGHGAGGGGGGGGSEGGGGGEGGLNRQFSMYPAPLNFFERLSYGHRSGSTT